jgi:hypothetical protein
MRTLSIFLVFLSLSGCSWERRVKHLSDTEFSHYSALKVWMTEEEQKAYLKFKEPPARDAYLVELGLWDRYYKLSESQKAQLDNGEVELGWTRDMVLMAWGQPHDMQKLVGRDAKRSERLVYRFEMHEGGVVYVWRPEAKTDYKAMRLFRKDVILDDDIVKEINKHDRW